MKVNIVNAQVPFVRGGAEYLADTLAERIRMRGHEVESLKIPFKWYPAPVILDHMLACRLMNVSCGQADLTIGLKFPAYMVPAANKRIWLLHQFRQVYELWGTEMACMPDTPENRAVRSMIIKADNEHLGECEKVYTISGVVADRMNRMNTRRADEVLYPPLASDHKFRPGPFGDYFVYPGRMNPIKRQHLAVEAMRYTSGAFRLVVIGKADTPQYEVDLRRKISEWGVEDRVELLGWVSDEVKAEQMAGACGCLNIPFEEDYGYVTLEAFYSHKPVITCNDSGGPTEFVETGKNGAVVDPTPEALAEAMESIWANKRRARELGAAAFATIAERNISWDYILDRLLG